jgi:hypothetical protein
MRTNRSAGSARHPDRTRAEGGRRRGRFARRAAAVFLVLAGVAFGLTPAAPQEQISYGPLNVPGAIAVMNPLDINAAGQAVVNYEVVNTQTGMYQSQAAVLFNGNLTPITIPGASFINAYGINDAGQIVGVYFDPSGLHGFFRSAAGQVSSINVAGNSTEALGINDAGQIVGLYFDTTGVHGFLRDVSGQITTIDSPNSPFHYTVATAINNFGQIAGYYNGTSNTSTTVTMHGFIRNPNGAFTVVDYPTPAGIVPSTQLTGLNDLGQAVGLHFEPSLDGFLTDQGGAFTNLDFPTPPGTTYYFTDPWGIDSASDIVGTYRDFNGSHGFTAAPVAAQLPVDPPAGTAAGGVRVLTRLEKALCLRNQVESFFDDAAPAGGVAAISVASRRTDLFTTDVIPFLSLLSLEGLGYDYLACSQTGSDPQFATVYTPVIHSLPPIPATGSISTTLATSLTDAMGHGSRAAAYLDAVSVSLSRYRAAVAAGNANAASQQETAALNFAKTATQELTAFAAGLHTVAGMVHGTTLDESVSRADFLAAMGAIRAQGAAALPGIERGGFRMFGLDPSYLLTGSVDGRRDDSRLATSLSEALVATARTLEGVADLLGKGAGH